MAQLSDVLQTSIRANPFSAPIVHDEQSLRFAEEILSKYISQPFRSAWSVAQYGLPATSI